MKIESLAYNLTVDEMDDFKDFLESLTEEKLDKLIGGDKECR